MNNKPATLHILTSQAWGGLEIYVCTLVKKLYDSGVKTAIYCLPHTKVEEAAQECGIPIYYAKRPGRFSFTDIMRLRKIIKNEGFSIIHSHTRQDVWLGSLSTLFLKRAGALRRFLQGLLATETQRQRTAAPNSTRLKHIFSLYMRASSKKDPLHYFIYSKVDVMTTSSEDLNASVLKNYPVKKHKIHLLRYGIELDHCKRDDALGNKIKKLYSVHESDVVVAMISRIDPKKGVKEFAQALLHLPLEIKTRVKFWLIGDPTVLSLQTDGTPIYEKESKETYDWLVNFAKLPEMENRLQIIPFQKDLVPYLSAIHIFVLATYAETYSLSVLEAMSMGIPVIGTNSGGTPEQLGSELGLDTAPVWGVSTKQGLRGLLVEPKSAQSIANAITHYISHPSLAEKFAQNAKEWVHSQHCWKKTLNQLMTIYSGPGLRRGDKISPG